MIKIPKKQLYRSFSVGKGKKKKFKRYTSYGKTLLWHKNTIKGFKYENKKYYVRTVKRKKDFYEIYLRKKVK